MRQKNKKKRDQPDRRAVHAIQEPPNMVAIRTACGRATAAGGAHGSLDLASCPDDQALVTCHQCKRNLASWLTVWAQRDWHVRPVR